MRRNPCPIGALFVASTLCSVAYGSVVWSYNGGTPAALPVSTLSVSGTGNTLRIYSTTGSEAIPAISLAGSVASGGDLCIIIASSTTPCSGGTPVVGGTTFAGLSFQSGSEDLRDASNLRLIVSGDATGATTVGRVSEFRPLGSIQSGASISATAADAGATRAIGVIQPDGAILGSISATNGSIGEVRSTSSVIGPSPGSSGPTISAAVDIGTIEAEVINATITASGVLNTINATVGGVHGSVTVGTIEGLSETVPDARAIAVSDSDDSTARIEATTITGSIEVHSLDNAGDTAGIFADEMNGWITVEGHVDTIDVDTLFPDYDLSTENPPLNKMEVGSIGHLKAEVAGVPEIGVENALPDLRADAIDHVEVGTLHLGLRGLTGATCAVGVMECDDVISPITNEFDEGETITIALQDVERFDIGNDLIDTTLLIDDDGSGDAPQVRIGGSLRVSEVVETLPYVSFTGTADLRANMIINAANNEPQEWAFWEEWVLPNGGIPSPIVLTPEYADLPDAFGGGAVGVVPFVVHEAQSDFLNEDGGDILISQFNHDCTTRPVAVEFYGPIAIPNGAVPPVYFELQVDTAWDPLERFAQFSVDEGNPRRLLISAMPPYKFPFGTYRVRTKTGSDGLMCDQLFVSDVNVGDFEYEVTLLSDCDVDCDEDLGTCENYGSFCDSIDFNLDSLFPDTLDFDDMLSVFGGGVCDGQGPTDPPCNTDIDFNNDGLFPDTDDLNIYLRVYSGGPCYCPRGCP